MAKILFISLSVINIFLFLLFSTTQHFPFYALLIHCLSIIMLLSWMLYSKSLLPFLRKYLLDISLVLSLFLIAFTIYAYKVDVVTPGVQGDEITIARAAEQVFSSSEYAPFVDTNYGHPTPLLYFTGLSIKLLGKTLFAIRLHSILFGALSVAAFYILLRLFFKKTLSVVTALMMLSCYPLVAVSRLAYEITPSLFFQILTLILLYAAWKTKNIRYYAAVGLSLGGGLYTYIGFRTFALIIVGFSLFQLVKTIKYDRSISQRFAVLLIPFFIIVMPLFSYSINHSTGIMARAKSLSPFSQGLPADEVYKELQGATFRLTNLFLPNSDTYHNPNGDPNLKQNPSRNSMFDIVTFLLFINGFIFLLKKDKKLFLLTSILAISPLFNDIFSLERIPEGHYYGIGHPNTLRIAGIIPIVYFIIAFGLSRVRLFFDDQAKGIYSTVLVLVASVAIALNWYIYFNQSFNDYVYILNGVKMMRVVDVLNKTSTKKVYLSPSFIKEDRIKYFTRSDIDMVPYTPKTADEILSDANSAELIIIDPDFNEKLGRSFLGKIKSQPQLTSQGVSFLVSPDNKIDAFILKK